MIKKIDPLDSRHYAKSLFLFLLLLPFTNLCLATIPVAHNGRFIPEKVYLQFQLKEEKNHVQQELFQTYQRLKEKKTTPREIEKILDTHFPIIDRLRQAGTTFQVLPSRFNKGEWYSLEALKILVYDSQKDRFIPLGNFTLYADENFNQIHYLFREWEAAKNEGKSTEKKWNELEGYLQNTYSNQLAGKPYQEAFEKALYYPTMGQLKSEEFYYRFPFLKWAIFFYGMATLAFGVKWKLDHRLWKNLAYGLLGLAFFVHTFILGMRCYILGRPPVSNMFETVVYVPWISVAISLIFSKFKDSTHPSLLMGASFSSLILLLILWMTGMNGTLENVQPVLDSQFWLLIHVLMVVGSYGLFILGGILGHFYLISSLYHKEKNPEMKILGQTILQSLYLGTLLLVSGTILGGVWAAQSWGRFWDWDPKESWAFISICIYLIIIHLFRFNKLGFFELAIGSIGGMLAISFTWYGVNYILGTGLHSYGFGKGGQFYYYAYLLLEILFLAYVWIYSLKKVKRDRPIVD